MSWTPLTPAAAPRPLPVLWLLVPWSWGLAGVAFFRHLTAAALGTLLPGAHDVSSVSRGAMCVGQLGMTPPLGTALAVALTWVWVAIAVPGHRRPWLWGASALLVVHWAVAAASAAGEPLCWLPPAAVVALPPAAAGAAIVAVFVAAAQGATDRDRQAGPAGA
jgi:hypothetical protein